MFIARGWWKSLLEVSAPKKIILCIMAGLILLYALTKIFCPLEYKVNQLEPGNVVKLKGLVIKARPGWFVLDDGTGRALIIANASVSPGDFVTVVGRVLMPKKIIAKSVQSG